MCESCSVCKQTQNMIVRPFFYQVVKRNRMTKIIINRCDQFDGPFFLALLVKGNSQ